MIFTSKANIELEFIESVKGTIKKIDIERIQKCSVCQGTKSKTKDRPSECYSCNGAGFFTCRRGPIMNRVICESCKGSGTVIQNPCTECKCTGVQKLYICETIEIPAGIENGTSIRIASKGHYVLNNVGDLVIKVKVNYHQFFSREGFDIYTDKDLTFTQAALGGPVEIMTIHGIQKLMVFPGTNNNDKIIMPNMGVISQSKKGNHIVKVSIKIPAFLSSRALKLLKEYAKMEQEMEEIKERNKQ